MKHIRIYIYVYSNKNMYIYIYIYLNIHINKWMNTWIHIHIYICFSIFFGASAALLLSVKLQPTKESGHFEKKGKCHKCWKTCAECNGPARSHCTVCSLACKDWAFAIFVFWRVLGYQPQVCHVFHLRITVTGPTKQVASNILLGSERFFQIAWIAAQLRRFFEEALFLSKPTSAPTCAPTPPHLQHSIKRIKCKFSWTLSSPQPNKTLP